MNNKLIRYNRFNELHELIEECRDISVEFGEPQCLCLGGRTGAGKTTLVRSYEKAHSRYETDEGTKIPVFYMETPSPVTVKGMAVEMLHVLGDPAADRGTVYGMNKKLVNFITDCGVQLVILDDFHHLIDAKTNRILREVSDWLKVLIKRTNIPFLITGIDGEVERILQANQQLSRLFVREELKPFVWDTRNLEETREFAAFIKYSEKTFKMQLSDEISREELLYRIHYATDGVMGYMMYLFRKASHTLDKANAENRIVTLEILADAFDSRLGRHVNKHNPFTVSPTTHFVPDNELVTSDHPQSITTHSRQRKPRKPTTKEVLTTR